MYNYIQLFTNTTTKNFINRDPGSVVGLIENSIIRTSILSYVLSITMSLMYDYFGQFDSCDGFLVFGGCRLFLRR